MVLTNGSHRDTEQRREWGDTTGLVEEAETWTNPGLKQQLSLKSTIWVYKRSGRRKGHWGEWEKKKARSKVAGIRQKMNKQNLVSEGFCGGVRFGASR